MPRFEVRVERVLGGGREAEDHRAAFGAAHEQHLVGDGAEEDAGGGVQRYATFHFGLVEDDSGGESGE